MPEKIIQNRILEKICILRSDTSPSDQIEIYNDNNLLPYSFEEVESYYGHPFLQYIHRF